jgi:hypothetical protein
LEPIASEGNDKVVPTTKRILKMAYGPKLKYLNDDGATWIVA